MIGTLRLLTHGSCITSRRSLGMVAAFSLLMFTPFLAADGEPAIARRISGPEQLDRKLPEVNFKDNRFEDVIDFLRDVTGANIFVNWRALELAGIPKDTKLTVQIKDVKFEKALRMILDRLGGRKMTVNYVVDEGVIENLLTQTRKLIGTEAKEK